MHINVDEDVTQYFSKHRFSKKPDLLIYTTWVYEISKQYTGNITKMASYLRLYDLEKFQKYFLFTQHLSNGYKTNH